MTNVPIFFFSTKGGDKSDIEGMRIEIERRRRNIPRTALCCQDGSDGNVELQYGLRNDCCQSDTVDNCVHGCRSKNGGRSRLKTNDD